MVCSQNHRHGVRSRLVLPLLLAGLVSLGVVVHDDYGVGWDDENNSMYGNLTLDYVRQLFELVDERSYRLRYGRQLDELPAFWSPVNGRFAKTHGPIFEVLLVALERQLPMEDVRDQVLFRHLCINLVFCAGVCFFFLLIRRLFSSWRVGLLAALLLVLSPRIFAHSFYNSMDIPFLSVYIACTYTLLRYLERTTLRNALVHGLACGVLISTRIAGIIVPAITVGFLVLELYFSRSRKVYLGRATISLLAYAILMVLVVVCAWPMLWTDPLGNFVSAFKVSANDPWPFWEIYMGAKVKGSEVPWHFTPVWMLITTPPLYSVLALVGLWGMVSSRAGLRRSYLKNRGLLVCLLCFLAPLVAVAVFGSTLFNGWRHMYFVYPGYLALAVAGLVYLWRRCGAASSAGHKKIGRVVVAGAVLASVTFTAAFMIRSHPHQIVYFNLFAGGLKKAKQNFQVGYWGAEYKEALEYLLENVQAHEGRYPIFLSDNPPTLLPVLFNTKIIPVQHRHKFAVVTSKAHGRFFFTNYSAHIPTYDGFEELWSREVDGVKILTVFRVR